ncbi:sensor domain-containing diguanylate cyclase [Alkalimonas sp.]|uniref:sensor domain-containing diguanylate cyclase n=1 Tax=Alkalimonas sp. TaxID=1872453 RepID=UPI00263AE07D|nr:sensor domain-containing diguanylate cyclase [Alkalimonas sp.]MCC5824843.1 sensor domain-containing diguanylate cyclase [Alkalimonas sp.]
MPTERKDTPHFWAIIDALPIAVLLKDTAKPDIFANQQALQLLGLKPSQQVLSLSDIRHIELTEPDSNEVLGLVQNPLLLALGGSSLHQVVCLNQNKFRVQLESRLIQLSFTLSKSVLIVLKPEQPHDIAAAGQSSTHEVSELEEALAFDKLISLISAELINVQPDELDTHIEDALTALGEFCHADRSYVFLFHDDMTLMSNTHEWVRTGVSSHKEHLQNMPESSQPYIWQVLQKQHVFVASDIEQLPAEAALEKQEFRNEDIQSILCSAMYSQGQLIGFVGCDMVARKRAWTNSDIRRLKLVGNMIGNTIQNINYRLSLEQMQQELLQANRELQELASRDGLTGIANRRHFDLILQQELNRCARLHLPLGLIMADIDYFKSYNDSYGHLAGDDVLKQVAGQLSETIKRQGELVARYGGEEFAIIVPGCSAADLRLLLENLRSRIEQLSIVHAKAPARQLTISLGASLTEPDKNTSSSELINEADSALYRAKAQGRNRAEVILPSENGRLPPGNQKR